jgi:hypothetical protein
MGGFLFYFFIGLFALYGFEQIEEKTTHKVQTNN